MDSSDDKPQPATDLTAVGRRFAQALIDTANDHDPEKEAEYQRREEERDAEIAKHLREFRLPLTGRESHVQVRVDLFEQVLAFGLILGPARLPAGRPPADRRGEAVAQSPRLVRPPRHPVEAEFVHREECEIEADEQKPETPEAQRP